VPVGVRFCLQLEEFGAEALEVDGEGAVGGGAVGEGGGEEGVEDGFVGLAVWSGCGIWRSGSGGETGGGRIGGRLSWELGLDVCLWSVVDMML